MQQFVDSSDALAPSFYTFLNEAIATAEWHTFGELNAVLLLDYGEAEQFTSYVPLLDTLRSHRGFAFLTGYKTKSRLLMLAGRDPTAVADVVARLATEDCAAQRRDLRD